MPRSYAYSPLRTSDGASRRSIEMTSNDGGGGGGGDGESEWQGRSRNRSYYSSTLGSLNSLNSNSIADDVASRRMPYFLGLLVLISIVFVLSNSASCSAGVVQTREEALKKTVPFIIECKDGEDGGDQSVCHLPRETRYEAVGQKGATLWMTGCSGAGKTTIAQALEDVLVKEYKKHVYRLDGDNIRTGLNRDLSFSASDRDESVRRVGEVSTLFTDAGVITIVGLISPYREGRDMVRKRHKDMGINFYEVFLDVPIEELKKRDPKGQVRSILLLSFYAFFPTQPVSLALTLTRTLTPPHPFSFQYKRVENGELKHFTCIDDPYEEPEVRGVGALR